MNCFDCKGEMVKPNPIHGYDFNKDGWVPFFCLDCGLCSDSNKIVNAHVVSGMLEHRFIQRVLENICKEKLNQDYVFKKELFKLLKNEKFFNVYDLAECIVAHCQGRGYLITMDYVLTKIYTELDFSAYGMVR